jgi:hypothetical protein
MRSSTGYNGYIGNFLGPDKDVAQPVQAASPTMPQPLINQNSPTAADTFTNVSLPNKRTVLLIWHWEGYAPNSIPMVTAITYGNLTAVIDHQICSITRGDAYGTVAVARLENVDSGSDTVVVYNTATDHLRSALTILHSDQYLKPIAFTHDDLALGTKSNLSFQLPDNPLGLNIYAVTWSDERMPGSFTSATELYYADAAEYNAAYQAAFSIGHSSSAESVYTTISDAYDGGVGVGIAYEAIEDKPGPISGVLRAGDTGKARVYDINESHYLSLIGKLPILPHRSSWLYIRWKVTEVVSIDTFGACQAAELQFFKDGAQVSLSGAVFTNPLGQQYNNNTSEGAHALFDGSNTTKLCDVNFETNGFMVAVVQAAAPIEFDSYSWVTARDASSRDPVSWTIEVSNDGASWSVLDEVIGFANTTTRGHTHGPFVVSFPI